MLKRFVFGVSGIVSKVLKMLVFPSFGARKKTKKMFADQLQNLQGEEGQWI